MISSYQTMHDSTHLTFIDKSIIRPVYWLYMLTSWYSVCFQVASVQM